LEKKKYRVKGKVNPLLAEIEEYCWAYTPLQAWHIIKMRVRKRFGWHYHLSQDGVEITEV